jgi:predicted ribosomally synthesized peptide with SipW-like signal peptide
MTTEARVLAVVAVVLLAGFASGFTVAALSDSETVTVSFNVGEDEPGDASIQGVDGNETTTNTTSTAETTTETTTNTTSTAETTTSTTTATATPTATATTTATTTETTTQDNTTS